MKPVAELTTDQPFPFSIRVIGETDIELLRIWKNEHRQYFFHKDEITPQQQQAWYGKFSQACNDHMFMIVLNGKAIGCIGARLLSDNVDAYNIILGDKSAGGKGIMSAALNAVCAFMNHLYPGCPIRVRVLRTNPAISWYQRNGFEMINEKDDYVVMELKKAVIGTYVCQATLSIPGCDWKLSRDQEIRT